MSTSSRNTKWPHVLGDRRPLFGPTLAVQPPKPWTGPWEYANSESRKRRRVDNERAANPPETERAFGRPHTTYASYVAEQDDVARKVRVTPALLANQNSQHFRVSEIGDHFIQWARDGLIWFLEIWANLLLEHDARRRVSLDCGSSDSSFNHETGSSGSNDDSDSDSSSDADSYNYNPPRAEMPIPQVLPSYLIPRPVTISVRSARSPGVAPQSTGTLGGISARQPMNYVGGPAQTSISFSSAIKQERFPKLPTQSTASTATGIIGQPAESAPENTRAREEELVGRSALPAASAQPVDRASSLTPATESVKPETAGSSSESVTEAESESSACELNPSPSSWRNVFGNPGLWLNSNPTQDTDQGVSISTTKPAASAAQSDQATGSSGLLTQKAMSQPAAQTETTRLTESQQSPQAQPQPAPYHQHDAAAPPPPAGSFACPNCTLHNAVTSICCNGCETQFASFVSIPAQSQPSSRQNAGATPPLAGFFACPYCTVYNAVTDTWCHACDTKFPNFIGIPAPADGRIELDRIENNEDELAVRNNAQRQTDRQVDYGMTGGAGPTGTVDSSGNAPLATRQEKADAERRREDLRQDQIRAERIMGRIQRPYYPPSREEVVPTDHEARGSQERERQQIATYMDGEQKVKYRLKKIRFHRDKARIQGRAFNPLLLDSFNNTPEERAQMARDLATIEQEDRKSAARQRQHENILPQIRSAVEQSRSSPYPFTHFMPNWPSLSEHERDFARHIVCAINEAAIAPGRKTRCDAALATEHSRRVVPDAESDDDEADLIEDFKLDLIRKRFEVGEDRFRRWWNTAGMSGAQRDLYKRIIGEINAHELGWNYCGSKVQPMNVRVDAVRSRGTIDAGREAGRLEEFAVRVDSLRGERLTVPENLRGWEAMTPEQIHQIWHDLDVLDRRAAGDESGEEVLTEEERLMMLANEREALVVSGLDAPENLPDWDAMTEERKQQIRHDWGSLVAQGRLFEGGG